MAKLAFRSPWKSGRRHLLLVGSRGGATSAPELSHVRVDSPATNIIGQLFSFPRGHSRAKSCNPFAQWNATTSNVARSVLFVGPRYGGTDVTYSRKFYYLHEVSKKTYGSNSTRQKKKIQITQWNETGAPIVENWSHGRRPSKRYGVDAPDLQFPTIFSSLFFLWPKHLSHIYMCRSEKNLMKVTRHMSKVVIKVKIKI